MARTPLIAGNWKLNLGPAAAAELLHALVPAVADRGDVQVAVFPTALAVPAAVAATAGSGVGVGIQDVHTANQGAYTGANSAALAREVGCTWALIGHSERRTVWKESDAQVRAKVELTLDAGLLPVVCIGETLEQRDAGEVESVVTRQLAAAVAELPADRVATLTFAYEPVWAIGTGRTATPEQAQAVHAVVRGWLAAHQPAFVAESCRILYGGSVKPANAAELLACPDIDGALVGGASLKAESFAAIVAAAG